MRVFTAFATLAALLGAVITYQVGGIIAASWINAQLFNGAGMLLAVAMFVAFSLMALSAGAATFSKNL